MKDMRPAEDPGIAAEAAPRPNVVLRGAALTIAEKRVLGPLDLSLDVRRVGVIGRNGSGKSSLVRLIAGLVAPSEGEVRIDGIDMSRDRDAAIRSVGVMFQNPDHQIIFPTVIEEVSFGLRQIGHTKTAAHDAAMAALDRFGKADWADRSTQALSQGQKHLLCLISVVAMGPRLLLLDEPFAGLDIPTRLQLRRYLDRAGLAVLHVTHDPADLDGYNQVIWLEEGLLKAAGPAKTVLSQYTQEMTRIGDGDDLTDLTG